MDNDAPVPCDKYQKLLNHLNAIESSPQDSQLWTSATGSALQWIIPRLASDLEPLGTESGYGHLFCDKGFVPGQLYPQLPHSSHPNIDHETALEIRSFQLRLISFKAKGPVLTWRSAYEQCIQNCVDCASGHVICTSKLRKKWLRLQYGQSDKQVDLFMRGISRNLVQLCEPHLTVACASNPLVPNSLVRSDQVSDAILTLVLSDPVVLTSPPIWEKMNLLPISFRDSTTWHKLPSDLILPGLILLSMSDSMPTSKFATDQLDHLSCQENFTTTLNEPDETLLQVMTVVLKILNRDHVKSPSSSSSALPFFDLVTHPTRTHAWHSLHSIITAIPNSALVLCPETKILATPFLGLPQAILVHIEDSGEHFPGVLKCFGTLLQRLGSAFWKAIGEVPSATFTTSSSSAEAASPQLVFRRILAAQSFPSEFVSTVKVTACLQWLLPFIWSLTEKQAQLEVFHHIHEKLTIELQRKKPIVDICVNSADLTLSIWEDLYLKHCNLSQQSLGSSEADLLTPSDSEHKNNSRAFKAHIMAFNTEFSDYLVNLAYEPQPAPSRWVCIRKRAQSAIENIAISEAQCLSRTVNEMSLVRAKIETNTPYTQDLLTCVTYTTSLWTRLYKTSNDFSEKNMFLTQVYSLLIRALSDCAHLGHLSISSWLPEAQNQDSHIRSTINLVNEAIMVMRAPMVDAMLDLSDSNFGSSLISVLFKDPPVMQALVVMIFSPNDGIHNSSLALVRQWADCTSRLDCFQVLLSRGKEAAFEGLVVSLKKAELDTILFPDAMATARRLVRCMTDVIEILCSRSNGLLGDDEFSSGLDRLKLVKFWSLMCSTVSNIFQRTPNWAKFWQTSEMTDWMRDALIFAEQLVEQFQTFETAATDSDGPNMETDQESKVEDVRSKMVDSFMRPTESLLTWLRLNDSDLLDRSTRVLVKMLEKLAKFRRPLKASIVDKLEKYINSNSNSQLASEKSTNSVLLTEQQCAYLTNALASHPDLSERFSVASIADRFDENIAPDDTNLTISKAASTPGWGVIFPSLKPNGREGEALISSKSAPLRIDVRPPSASGSRLSPTDSITPKSNIYHLSAKNNLAIKPPPRKFGSVTSNTPLGNLRREFKASRQIIHQSRPAALRPVQPTIGLSRQASSGFPRPSSHSSVPSQSDQADSNADLESEPDSEDGQETVTGLAALAKVQKTQLTKPKRLAEPTRKIKMFHDPGLERHRQMAQAARQRQQRLNLEKLRMSPDFTALHRHILQWDYNHTGPCPPNMGTHYNHLPPAFEDFPHYLSCLEPLLMCECWQQICQAKETIGSGEKQPIPCEVIGRASVDDFIEICATIKHGLLPDRMFFTEADLVLLKTTDQGMNRSIMAKVLGLHRKPEWFELNLRLSLGDRRQDISGSLVPKTKWQVIHLCSLSTTHREWAALKSLPYLTLADSILEARVSSPAPVTDEQLAKVMQFQKVNEPQGRAIISSLSTPGFSLIQGPPGTGKTSTILGLIGAFIASRPSFNHTTVGPESISRKILLCAPSNAAVDEVAKRLKEGVRGAQGELIIPKLVRIGAEAKVHVSVKDIFIDELVEAASRLAEPGQAAESLSGSAALIQDLRQQITELRATRDSKQIEAERLPRNSPQYSDLQAEVSRTRRRIHELSQKIDEARDQQSASKRSLDAATRKLRMQILQDADVICSTLSGSGHDYMSQLPFDFETVVIDEACQCVEPASLIPLRYNATQCILVGDPLQLPPTVLSQTAARAGYDQSLFVRMHKNAPDAAHLLSIQYRMHPTISSFPSKAFYQSRLADGPGMAEKTAQLWHASDSLFPTYAFYHPIGGKEERGSHHSLLNRMEAALAVAIYSRLIRDFPEIDFAYRVGIITGYSAQVREIRNQFKSKFPPDVVATIDINTVDGFQGQEKDIIILSCVRAGSRDGGVIEGGIGFLKDTRRMNVALTRAKSSLFIIGNQVALRVDPNWSALLDDAADKGALRQVTTQTFAANAVASLPPRIGKSVALQSSSNSKVPNSEPIGRLLTPKQITQQSKARARAANDSIGLKRRIPEDQDPGPVSAQRPKIEPGDPVSFVNNPVGSTLPSVDQNRPYNAPPANKSIVSTPALGTGNQAQVATTSAQPGTVPFQPNASSSRPPQQVPAKKPAASLFIKKKQRPPPPIRRNDTNADPRSVKQRFQDELGRQPPH